MSTISVSYEDVTTPLQDNDTIFLSVTDYAATTHIADASKDAGINTEVSDLIANLFEQTVYDKSQIAAQRI